ncbi:uncharacterized protein ATNIH1004_006993 [Aspergillus tanneri]|nr:uncharacterized protein ATNIH1004_006993 [Aspergillus tanneri]KAA8645574.1 hypothetical protein ATNIH1004_006993 [Aspergillus tanneri]
MSAYDMGTADSQHSYSRQALGVDHTVSYEDESPDAYNPQSSAYIVPSTSQGVLTDYCELPWNHKAWNPSLSVNRDSNGALFPAHDPDNTLHQPAYSYMFSGQGTQSTDPSIGSSTAEGQGTDRTLPNPTGRYHAQIGLTSFTTSPEATLSALPLSQDYRVPNSWASKGIAPNSVRTSMQPTSNGAFGASPMTRSKPFPTSAQDVVFGFLPMSSTVTSSPLMPSSGAFTTLDTGESGDELRGNDPRLSRGLSRDSGRLLSSTESSSDIYGYSSRAKSKKCSDAGDSGRAGTLVNGLPYTRPKHSDYEVSLPYGALSTDASPEVHRTPVPALSNLGGF